MTPTTEPVAGVVRVRATAVAAVRRHARASWPLECAGALLGPDSDEAGNATTRAVYAAVPATGAELAEDRYLLGPDELRRLEREAAERGLSVTGFYHSHPAGSAAPSARDEEAAWPWYLYLVQAVDRVGPGELAAWALDEARRFRPWRIETTAG
jgi:proteasome lid subunit RPN8/RPN11